MPTSTIWRRGAGAASVRGVSPIRPSGDAIERISPEPSFTPTFSDGAYMNSFTLHNQDSLHGLGLLRSSFLGSANSSRHPEELYIDQNGGALPTGPPNSHPEHYKSPPQEWSSRSPRQYRNHKSTKNRGHTRSGSTIDDLASAAIATSPTFANGNAHSFFLNGSPTAYSPTRPSTSHLAFQYESAYEPPAKRVKSERLPTVEWEKQPSRPTTSHQQSSTTFEDVELLLGLRTEVNFTKQVSPPTSTVQLHESSPQPARAFSPPISALSIPKAEELEASENQSHVKQSASAVIPTDDHIEPKIIGIDPEKSVVSHGAAKKIDMKHGVTAAAVLEASVTALGPVAVSTPEPEPTIEVKKTRRVKPQLQAEVCAECNKFQRESDDEDSNIYWISCNGCDRWFHSNCVGFKGKAEARSVDKFVCKRCEPQHGQTTFVRKSSRARTAIDYAGLNQGFVKSSIETSMHHYIAPIKAGKFAIQQDDFARVRPELLTVEFMESFDNMKRPFVVPACWNPRFGAPGPLEMAVVEDESMFKVQRLASNGAQLDPEVKVATEVATETVIDCDQDLLDMVMPRDLTVRKVAELYGSQELVPVIDVKSQETKGIWSLEQWADYYELQEEKPIRNVISLEVSDSPLGRLIRRPKVVRDLDLEDQVWDAEARANQKKRPVQYYCLMSVADSYTDFHIDFGGSSVYYHILKGTKTFFFVPPEDRYLKKYEEWCNSQTQNDTWLPDLCNGAVTRVDLHEGDTAFIPAGWIHSVWTPEDSLVIGGNFLTRIDYELQLKVANVEKVTKVAPKFRYPFFQKVMWYALIKYLDEDPVPDEVLQDFQDDPEYTFLRANPIWHEFGDLATIAEPGSAEFNARYYPKTEIKGLPPLRDYLYRTARIYADLPVPDINKRQVEAVKNSVPKGHGEPLVLIKTFAIWCAWKMGGVTVPEWVYSDGEGFPESERKIKRTDSFRVPGERMSQRRATQSLAQEPTGAAVVTPYKPGFSTVGVSPDSNKKSKPSTRRPGPSGVRSACDACRKRRVRCPHRVDGTLPESANAEPVARSQSPIAAQVDSDQSLERTTNIAPMPSAPSNTDSGAGVTYLSSNVAQAALATVDPRSYDQNGISLNGFAPSSAKKSRSKACEECRKSKRRCVHDEYGRVDPAKAAEPSKPRGSSNTKRPARPSDENLQVKRARIDEEADGDASLKYAGVVDGLIDPALFDQVEGDPEDPMEVDALNGILEHSGQSVEQAEEVAKSNEHISTAAEPFAPLATNEPTDFDAIVKQEPNQSHSASLMAPTNGLAAIKDAHASGQKTSIADEVGATVHNATPRTSISPVQRHSSRQAKQVERYIPADHRSPTKPPPKPARSERRGSSAASGQSVITNLKSRRSSSNTSGTIHHMAAIVNQAASPGEVIRPVSRGSTADSELTADERMARELQAEEHGLRRRQSMRV